MSAAVRVRIDTSVTDDGAEIDERVVLGGILVPRSRGLGLVLAVLVELGLTAGRVLAVSKVSHVLHVPLPGQSRGRLKLIDQGRDALREDAAGSDRLAIRRRARLLEFVVIRAILLGERI